MIILFSTLSTCDLPACDWVDYGNDSIEPGHKVGTIPPSGNSRDTFRIIFIISLISHNVHIFYFVAKLRTFESFSFELKLTDIPSEHYNLLSGNFYFYFFQSSYIDRGRNK